MGVTEGITEAVYLPIKAQVGQHGLFPVVAVGFVAFIALSVVLNVLNQILFKNPNEPPVVFHWFPILGNTIKYGMDPYGFFEENRAKVRFAH